MRTTVWKYPLNVSVDTELDLPSPAIVVHVAQADGVTPAVWVQVRPDAKDLIRRTFRVVGTGDDVPAGWAHIGSCWCGPFMWHVYERPLQ